MNAKKECIYTDMDDLGSSLIQLYERKNYAESTLRQRKKLIGGLKTRIIRAGLPGYCPEFGKTYLEEKQGLVGDGKIQHKCLVLYRTIIRHLDDLYYKRKFMVRGETQLPALPEEMQEQLERFLHDCATKGNRESTLRNKRDACIRFIQNLEKSGCSRISEMNGEHVHRAVLSEKNHNLWRLIRQYLRFLYEDGFIKTDYSGMIPQYCAAMKAPPQYTKEEITAIEEFPDRSTVIGKRNYAMILLASRLGIRRGDIVNLRMCDIDFEENRIRFIQQKTGIPIELPLVSEIREALSDYMAYVRPSSDKEEIFQRIRAPHGKLTPGSVYVVISAALKGTGADTAGKRQGPHALRASMASAMVNDGIPYQLVSEALGHGNRDAIQCYARLDIENLRKCAVNAIPATGFFKAFLEGVVTV